MKVLGKYDLIRRLATGGMGDVFLGRLTGPNNFVKRVVIKRVHPHIARDPDTIALFQQEARVAALIEHPNVVPSLDFGTDHDNFVLVMEYVDGGSLSDLVRETSKRGEQLDFRLGAYLLARACEGLAAAHAVVDPKTGASLNLVHRDLSPDTILVSRQGAVRVTGFGLARGGPRTLSAPGLIRRKLASLAPEQLRDEPLDARTDVWAVGVTLYELFGGARPFEGENDPAVVNPVMNQPPPQLSSLRRDCPPALDDIVTRCLHREPQKRYADCRELGAALDQYVQSTGPLPSSGTIGAWVVHLLGEAVRDDEGADAYRYNPLEVAPASDSGIFGGQALSPDGAVVGQSRTSSSPSGVKGSPPTGATREVFSTAPRTGPSGVLELDFKPKESTERPITYFQPAAVGAPKPRRVWLAVVLGVLTLSIGAGAVMALRPQLESLFSGRRVSSVSVDSAPPGAVVEVAGTLVGRTPWFGDSPPVAKPFMVTVHTPGFDTYRATCQPGIPCKVIANLRKSK